MDAESRYPNIVTAMTAIGKEFLGEYRTELLARSLSQSAALADSMFPQIIADHHALHLAIGLAGYWYYVEYGRRPGKQPPIDAMEAWINKTGMVPYPDENGKTPSVRSLAFLIARKIGREGTKGKGIIHDIVERNQAKWIDRIRRAASADVDNRVRTIFKKLS